MSASLLDDFRYAHDPVAWSREVVEIDPDEWQGRFLCSQHRNVALRCSRQSGKSTISGIRVAHRLKFRRKYFVVCVAPSERQSVELFEKIKFPLSRAGDLEVSLKDNVHEIILPNGSRCVCLPSNPDTIRGFSAVNELLADEAAMIEDAVFAAVRPMLMVSRGTLVMMSTPKGQRGYFYESWQSSEVWDRYTVKCYDIPRFAKEDIEREKKELGEWMFRQEYECEFLSTLDAVFPAEQVRAAISDEVEAFAW
jgi:hypothetical protein